MSRLDETRCRPGSPLNRMFTAGEAAVIKRFINSFQVRLWNGREPFVDRTNPYGEYTIYLPRTGDSFPWSKLSFGYALAVVYGGTEEAPTVTTTCTINSGTLRIHGIGTVSFPESEITLLAETCTVYAQAARGSLADGTIHVSASPSATSNTHYWFPLYTFTYDATTERHALDTIHHFGDLHLDVPVM
jgi:hypothetical protein